MATGDPVVIMIAGPNAAGKTSIAPGLLAQALNVLEFVNADVIAKGISGFNADAAAISAGRIMLTRLDELAEQCQSFAFETTGASRSFVSRITPLQMRGYRFLGSYIWIDSPEVPVTRVAQRVMLGGHSIPEETIRRRYLCSVANLFNLYRPIADEWRFYDNSLPGNAILLAEGGKGRVENILGVDRWSQVRAMAKTVRDQG